MTDIEYKSDPLTWQDYFQLFSSTGWILILKVSESDLKKVFSNIWYWITVYQDRNIIGAGRLISDGSLYALICDIKPDSMKSTVFQFVQKRHRECNWENSSTKK
ncbi:hypothetical protein [Methanosarcina horonobensis]|nr:hypothetical protein [Methanosarcina horonobensis]